MKKVKIALLGLGNVGRGVYIILHQNKEEIMKRSGYEIEISKILVRDLNKNRGVEVPEDILTTDFEEILNDDSIKLVVEVMGGIEPAREYMLRAMEAKKHIVTANKMLLATEGDEVFEKAEEMGVMFQYEASVAGGIPIINGINENLTANKVNELYGIVNGTTNYILSKMSMEEVSYEEALAQAQKDGIAEANPSLDVLGYDTACKIVILANVLMDANIKLEDIEVKGITEVKLDTIKESKKENEKLKLKNFKLENSIENKEKLSEIKITLKTKIDNLDLGKSEAVKNELEKEIDSLNKSIGMELKNIELQNIEIRKNIESIDEKRKFINDNRIFSDELLSINEKIDKIEKKIDTLENSNNLYLENYKKAMEKSKLEKNLESIKTTIKNSEMRFQEKNILIKLKREEMEKIDLKTLQEKDLKVTFDIEEIREKLGAVNREIENLKMKLDEIKKYEDLLKNKRKYLEKLNMKLELTKIFREKIKSMGKEVSKNMLKEIEILATENFRKITGRGEKIVWSNEDKNKYVVFLDGDRGELKFEKLFRR